jgi:hypothetical protein
VLLVVGTAAGLFLAVIGPVRASAAPPVLWNPDRCQTGSAAGECEQPRGVAASPDDGHVFVADNFNSRIVELDALGNFIKAWGWDVVEGGGVGFEVCVPEEGHVCKAGVRGSGRGQFDGTLGVALDSLGDVYVVDFINRRVQKFDRQGNFLLMFGGDVNQTKVAEGAPEAEQNRCPVDVSDVCQAGSQGTGDGQFGSWAVGSFIAIDPADNLYVGDANRIQRFSTDGSFSAACTVPGTVQSLDVDSDGNLYASYQNQVDVRKLTFVAGGGCQETKRFEIPELGIVGEFPTLPTAVAVDTEGHVFAFCCPNRRPGTPLFEDPIFEFDPAGNVVTKFGKEEFEESTGLATNLCPGSDPPGNLYVSHTVADSSFVRAYGTAPLGCFKALTEPATNVTETSATLNGTVNPNGSLTSECRFEWDTTTAYGNVAPCAESPAEIGEGTVPVSVHADISGLQGATVYHFRLRARIGGETETSPDREFKTLGPPAIGNEHLFAATDTDAVVKALVNPEGLPTSCQVQYGTTATYGNATPKLGVGEDRSEHPMTVVLENLQPGTTYHWRFVCENSAIGGVTEGEDRTLITYRRFATETGCGNDAFRTGASALLPDCRAYEMVSPVDKNGADIVVTADDGGSEAYVQAAPDGDALAYSAKFPAFGDPLSSFNINQYLATRRERGEVGEGWSSEAIRPPFLSRRLDIGVGVSREFMAFTPDLCTAWLADFQTPPFQPDGQVDAANLYRRQNCDPGEGSFETLTTAELSPEVDRKNYVTTQSVQGVSADGRHAIFAAAARLINDEAAPGTHVQLYDRFGGGLHLVSVLPAKVADATDAVVGSGWGFNLENAVSADGSAVYWTSGVDQNGRGQIFLRQRPEQGIVSGECVNAKRACTIAVSAGTDAFFWAAARDGSGALYVEGGSGAGGGDLFRFEAATKSSQPVVGDIMGVVGVSQDLSRVYFVSRQAIAGSGANSQGEASPGEPNLYLAEAGGGVSFIATLAEGDVGALESGAFVTAYNLIGSRRPVRVTPSGSRLAFQSRAPIGDFDNTAAGVGRPAVEVYLYEAGGELLCVSCNPSGARPAARHLSEPYRPKGRFTNVFAAAWIPTWEHPQRASNLLSEDGSRLFFNANDALVPHDTNGTQDVYEWEALGAGGCEPGDPSYFEQNDGCLYLISSGQNSFESIFWEASPDGDDVFFTTAASLLSQDPGSIDLYDARVGGGFPPATQAVECEGEACQSPPPPPQFNQPASGAYQGPGNQVKKPQRPCRKGKRKVRRGGKVRCVSRKKAKGKSRSARGKGRQEARR